MSPAAAILAAAGVGFGHAVLPDHWLPLAAMARSERHSPRRVARLAGLAGVAHVAVSIMLGAIVIAVGLGFRSTIEHDERVVVGGLLILTGVALAALELTGHGHIRAHAHDHAHGHDHTHGNERARGHGHSHAPDDDGSSADAPRRLGLARIVPFGAAASPDLTILPAFLAAGATGAGTAAATLAVFGAVTIGTIVTLTVLATAGAHAIRGAWLERWANLLTATILVLIGALVAINVL